MKLHHMTGLGLSNIYLCNGFTIENSDGDETIAYENLTGLYFEISRAIASKPFTLRAEEFRFVRKQLHMSQSEVAALFDKSDQAVAKWEKGLLPVPKAESTLLKIFWLSQKVRGAEFKSTVLSFKTSFEITDQPPIYAFSFDNGVWQLNVGAAKTYLDRQSKVVNKEAKIRKAKASVAPIKQKALSTSHIRLNGASQWV